MLEFKDIKYQVLDLHPRYAKNGDKVYSYILDDEDNEIPQIFTVKHVSVSYNMLQTKEYKELEKKINSLIKNYSDANKDIILDLMNQRKQIESERGYIRSDELDSKYDKKDLDECYTFIVTEEEYDKYGDGSYFRPFLLEISTCKIVKEI